MTLLDIKNALYLHFLQKTSFCVNDDSAAITLGGVYDDPKGKYAQHKPSLLRAALDDMAKQGVCLCVDAETGLYVLTQPIGSYSQTVVLSSYTANLIGDAFNLFARETGQPIVANKLAISDTEISCIGQVALALHERVQGLEDELEDLMDDMGMPPGPGGPDSGSIDPSAN